VLPSKVTPVISTRRLELAADVVACDALSIHDGYMRLPTGAGIGLAVDADALDAVAVERAEI